MDGVHGPAEHAAQVHRGVRTAKRIAHALRLGDVGPHEAELPDLSRSLDAVNLALSSLDSRAAPPAPGLRSSSGIHRRSRPMNPPPPKTVTSCSERSIMGGAIAPPLVVDKRGERPA